MKCLLKSILFFAVALLLLRCSSYASKIAEPRNLLEAQQYDNAIEKLRRLAEAKDNDELLYLMDLGYAYHLAGYYKEAIETFLKADKIAEIVDYTSLSQEVGSVILNDDIKPYKGENFEKLLINMYLAIDYTLSHQYEDALVECRRVNHKLDMMISQGGLPYEQNSFAKYLAAALFESRNEINDAFVDYRTVLKWAGDYPYVEAPLLRLADKLKASQEFSEFKEQFPKTEDYKISKNQGEVILLLETGRAPVKVPSQQLNLVPVFKKRSYFIEYGWLEDKSGAFKARTYPLYSIETTAIRELDQRLGAIVAKKIGGVVAKEVIAYGIEQQTKSPLLGFITRVILHGTDRADLRSWTTLPAQLQIARLTLPVGKHDIVFKEGNMNRTKEWSQVEVKPLEKVFLNYRTRD